MLGLAVPQFGKSAHEGTRLKEVAEAVRILSDGGYNDAFVDFLYVVTGTDAQLEWVKRLLAMGDR